jgi:hypothetical protein
VHTLKKTTTEILKERNLSLWSSASAAVELIIPSSGLLRGVRWFETDVSGLDIGPIFKSQVLSLTLEDNNPEDGRIPLSRFYFTPFP